MPRRSQPAKIVDVLGGTPAGDDRPTASDPAPAAVPTLVPTPTPVPARRLHAVAAPAEQQLSPDQRRIRELEDKLAKEMGKEDPEQELEVADQTGETILIRFVADGLTVLGHTWYRGQELEFTVGSPAYQDTFDRNGWSWLSLRDNPAVQEAKYGEEKFRSGAWSGLPYEAGATKGRFEKLTGVNPPTAAELSKADDAERKRKRAAPRLPVN